MYLVYFSGQGAGVLNIQSNIGIILSQTYTIKDVIQLDYGVTGKKSEDWFIYNSVTATVTDEGTSLSYSGSNAGYFINKHGTSTNNWKDWNTPLTIECDLKYGDTSLQYFQFYDTAQILIKIADGTKYAPKNNWYHVKIEVNLNDIKLYINDVLKQTETVTLSTFQMRFLNPNYITFKNFLIY